MEWSDEVRKRLLEAPKRIVLGAGEDVWMKAWVNVGDLRAAVVKIDRQAAVIEMLRGVGDVG